MIWSGTYIWKTLCPKPLENYTLSAFWRSVKPPLRTWWQYSVATSDQYLSMHTSLTEAQNHKIEFVQKRALWIILGRNYTGYDEALKVCKLPSLNCRRDTLLENFGMKMFHSVKLRHLLPPTKASTCSRQLRNMSGLCTIRCHTERYHKSTIPFLTRNLKVWILLISSWRIITCPFNCLIVFFSSKCWLNFV